MGAFEDFLKRTGYVKLDRYGLVLTPDDRILSTRPAVLDDGLRGKIVGWADDDLAAAELDHWGAAAKPAAAKRVAVTGGLQSAPPVPRLPSRPPRPTAPMPAIAPPPPVTRPAVVAAAPVVEEDEWEWEIAMARARAVADEVQIAAASIASALPLGVLRAPAKPGLAISTSFTKPSAAKKTMQMAAIATKPEPLPAWPVTETIHESWEATRESPAPAVMSPAAKSLAVVKTSVRSLTPPATPIPAKRTTAAQARTRLARGTDTNQVNRDDTVVTAVPAIEDATSPYVMVPAEVKPTGYAHTKRVAAKHR